MTEERRRTTDPMLAELFRQSERQHSANQEARNEDSRKLDAISTKLGELLRTDDQHGYRIGTLEAWRKETVDPFLTTARDGIAQAKGAGKLAKFLYTAAGLVGGGILYKIGAAFLASLPK